MATAIQPSELQTRFLAGLLILLAGCAGPTPSASEVRERYAAARGVYNDEGPAKALPLFEQLLDDYRGLGDIDGEALTLGQLGNCYKHFGDYPQALVYLERALELNRVSRDLAEEGWTVNSIGLVYWNMADYPEAISSFTRALEIARSIKDQKLEATVLNNTALVYDEQGLYSQSQSHYLRALEVFRSLGDRSRENYVLGNLGGVLLLSGEFRQAAEYYRQALEISRELRSKPSQSMDQGNLGICLLGMGRIKEASQELDSALALAVETGQVKEQADWHRGKASLFLRTGQYPLALRESQAALETYSRAGLKREQVEALEELGELQLLSGQPEKAEASFREGLEIARSIGHRRGEIAQLLSLGDLHQRRQDYTGASSLYEEALGVAQSTGDRLNRSSILVRKAELTLRQGDHAMAVLTAEQALRVIEGAGAVFAEAEAQLALADALRSASRFREALDTLELVAGMSSVQEDPEVAWRLHHLRGHALEGLDRNQEALDAYSQAIDVLQNVRYRLRDAGWSTPYLEDRYEPFLDVARLSIRAGKNSEAYEAAGRLRLRSYLDLVNEKAAPPSGDVNSSDELRERISHLRQIIEKEKGLPLEEQRRQALEGLVKELSEAQARYRSEAVPRPSGNWRNRLVSMSVPRLEEIQDSLAEDTAVLEYLVGEDALHTFVIRRGAIRARSEQVTIDEIGLRVEFLRDTLLHDDTNDWLKPSRHLYNLLVGPLEKAGWLDGVRRIYVVPHRVLHYLPFAVLAQSDGDSPHLLIEDFELSYLPSALLLISGEKPSAASSLLAMAPSRSGLRFPPQEVRELARRFDSPVKVLIGESATESQFKQNAADYRVVHLATHGTFNRWNPLLSELTLEADQTDDGDLHVWEILDMRIRAELVTLSACNTGLGSGAYADFPVEDDALGLTRALLFAGAGTVLATLWDVDDQSTLELVERFYSGRGRLGDARSLAEAQRSMLKESGRYHHPRYWAGFTLFGGLDEISAKKNEIYAENWKTGPFQ